jgi:hypothetical protein
MQVQRSGPTRTTREVIDEFREVMKKLKENERLRDMNIAYVNPKCESATLAAAAAEEIGTRYGADVNVAQPATVGTCYGADMSGTQGRILASSILASETTGGRNAITRTAIMSSEPSVKAREIPRRLLVSRAIATEAAEQQCAAGSIADATLDTGAANCVAGVTPRRAGAAWKTGNEAMSMLRGVDERHEVSPDSHNKKQKGQPYQLKHSSDDHNRTDNKFSKVIKIASLSHPAQEDTKPSITARVRNDNIWLRYPLFENNDYSSCHSIRCRNGHRQRQTASTLDCGGRDTG